MAIAMFVLLIGNAAVATIITVNGDGTADYTTIQDAIDASSNGDEIIVGPGTYTNIGDWVFDPNGKAIWLHSSEGATATVINGEGLRKGASLTSNETNATIIEGFTFTNCIVGMYCDPSASPIIRWCVFSGNTNPGGSGAGFFSFGSPTIEGCSFVGNSCNSAAGAYLTHGEASMTNCVFTYNSAQFGGALAFTHTSASITDCYFSSNTAALDGGAVYVSSNGTPTFTNCGFSENVARNGGGLAVLSAGSTATMNTCTFLYNSSTNSAGAFSGGGAIYNQYANIVLNDCTMKQSSAYMGGAILFYQATGTLTGCLFEENIADQGGGAICGFNATYDLLNCTFDSNSNTDRWNHSGGGAMANYGGVVSMTSCVMNNNSAYKGGALYNNGTTVAMSGCSITNNIVQSQGGGTYSTGSFVTVEECDSSSNIAKGEGSGSEGEGSGVFLSFSSTYEYIGANTSDEIIVRNLVNYASDLQFDTDATCDVTGNVSTSTGGSVYFDINILTADEQLHVNGDLVRRGAMGITNATGSLSAVAVDDIIPLAQAATLSGAFSSVTFPIMPSGLGLQLIEQSATRSEDTEVAVRVVEVEEAEFSSPFTGDLDSPPLDVESFDANGDGIDEIVVLFDGTPGGIACFDISEDGAPVQIAGFTSTVGNAPVDLDVADLNGDGYDDVIVANGASNTVSVLTTVVGTDGALSFDPEVVLSISATSTCIAIIDWDGDSDLDAVVGIDTTESTLQDGYRVLLDVAGDYSIGPWFSISMVLIDGETTPNPPTCVDGGEHTDSWGFVGGTQYGVTHRANSSLSLREIAELGSNTNTIEAIHLDGTVDGNQIDLMVASDEAEMVFLFKGNAGEMDGFDDFIPVAVSEPVEDIVALDADFDGDIDIIMLSPNSDTPLVLLRNDGTLDGLVNSLAGTTWSKQDAGGGEKITKVTGGDTGGKNEADDWLISVGSDDDGDGLRLNEPVGVIESTSLGSVAVVCAGDLNSDSNVNIHDLLILIGEWGATNSIADMNEDGIVNIHDLLILVAAWGPCA